MLIDFHVHCFPEELARDTVPRLAEEANIQARLPGTISALQDSMAEAGIDYSVLQNIATRPSQTEKINNWAAEVQKENENLFCFGTVHPEYENPQQEFKRIKDLGLKGVKFHPDYQEFFVDQNKYFPLYEMALQQDLILLFHAGEDIGLPAPQHCTPERFKKIATEFAGEKIIAAHMGGYNYWEEVEKHLVGKDCYLDSSYSQKFMTDKQFLRIIKNHGPEKIIFATDSPWADQKEEVERISSLGLDPETEKKIFADNAAQLLGIN
ncbi:MAG: amidohydrolase family protein [Halanaerobiaceae bacterium]